jgi:hypothetical protein
MQHCVFLQNMTQHHAPRFLGRTATNSMGASGFDHNGLMMN